MDILFSNKTYIACFFIGLLTAYLSTPFVRRLAIRFGVVDRPTHRKIHDRSVPLMGGLAIFLGMWTPILLLSFWDNDITAALEERWSEFLVIAMAGFAVMLSGIIDDQKGLNASKKLIVQVPIALVFAIFIGHFDMVNIPWIGSFQLGSIGILITIVWIVGITNALNLIDGIDGLAAGVAFFVAITNSVLAIMDSNTFLALIMLGMAGACLGFLRYNFEPAKIFLGDTGSLFLGMTLATTSVLSSSKSTIAASMLVAVIVLGYPVLDTFLAIARRSLKGKPVLSADMGHIHHRLLEKGLNHRYSVVAIYVFCALLSLLALSIVAQNSLMMLLTLAIVSALLAFGLYFLGFLDVLNLRTENKKDVKSHFKVAHHFGEFLRAKMSMAKSMREICTLFEQACLEFGICRMRLERLNDNGGNDLIHTWTDPNFREGDEGEGREEKTGLKEESFSDSRLGLKASFTYRPDERGADLNTEHMLQLSLLMETAVERMAPILAGNAPE